MNQFFALAIAEKVPALKTEADFRERARRANAARAREISRKAKDLPPLREEELAPAHAAHDPETKCPAPKNSTANGPAKSRARKAGGGR